MVKYVRVDVPLTNSFFGGTMNSKFVATLGVVILSAAFVLNPANAAMGGKKYKISPCTTKGNSTAQSSVLKSKIKQTYCATEAPNIIFVVSNVGLTWDEALLIATQIGGQLTGIRNSSEQDLVNQMNGLIGYAYYWTGGYDSTGSGRWVWQDSNQVFATGFSDDPTNPLINSSGVYTNWLYGEPNNPGQENCIHGWNGPAGAWNNIPCNFAAGAFVMRIS